MEVFVLFDEEFGECKVFLNLDEAMEYYEKEDIGDWSQLEGDDSLWVSDNGYFYIFRRKVIA
jgi:hypothetical protein